VGEEKYVPYESQIYAEPKLSDHEGRALWQSIYRDLRIQRLLTSSLTKTLIKQGFLTVLLVAALWLSWFATSWMEYAVAWTALALLLAQFAFVGHDAGHGSITWKPAINRAIGQFSMTLVAGLAFDEWIARHLAHHRFCQDETRDPDMAVAFVASLTVESKLRKGPLGRLLTRCQSVHIWLLTLLFGHSQRHLSQIAVLCSPRRNRLDAVILILHFTLWFGVPCLLLDAPFLAALLAYAIPATLLGPYLAAIFWVNHIGMPLIRKVESFSFFEHQVVTSRTITNPPAWDWFFGGLNYQIEHHLFPRVASHRLPAVQTIVRRHFALHHIAYNGVSWHEAVRMIAAHFRQVAHAV
jgi:fatty acid desaturase